MTISRRDSLTLGAAALGATSIPLIGARAAVDDVPTADVKPLNYQIEKGAALHILRPAKFVDADEVVFKANTQKFIAATGVDVKADSKELGKILAPQTGGGHPNTGSRRGRHHRSLRPSVHIYTSKIADMFDLGNYPRRQIRRLVMIWRHYIRHQMEDQRVDSPIPTGGGTGPTVYRVSWGQGSGLR